MRRVVDATGVPIVWDVQELGEQALALASEEEPGVLPARVLDSIRRNKVAIKGPLTTPVGYGFRSINVALRKQLDLYTNLRPTLSIPGTGARYDDVDLVLFRENTEDLYAGIEFEEGSEGAQRLRALVTELGAGDIRADAGISLKPISEFGTRRIMKAAMDYAVANGRRKVTIVHKANIMKHTDGLFLRVARQVAADYAEIAPDIEVDDFIVDATCMRLVINPRNFDMLVCPNLFGDIVSDLCAGLVGGLGLAPGANIGDAAAVFEPVHGSAPSMAGQDKANPTALILSAALMLRHLGFREAADRVQRAIAAVIAAGQTVTYDLRRTRFGTTEGAVGTAAFADAVIAALE
jgi:isocitrate dehydrogenase (NAD+)